MQIPWNALHSFLLSCGDKHSPKEFGKEILLRIDQLIPFDQGRFYILDRNGKITYAFCIGVDSQVEQQYYDFYSNVNSVEFSTVASAAKFAAHNYSVEDCIRKLTDFREEDGFFQDYVKPNRIIYSFGLPLQDTHHSLRGLISLDRTEDIPYTPHEIEIMKVLRPNLDNLHQNFYAFSEPTDISESFQAPQVEILSKREKQIADLLLQGVTPKNISKILYISPTTVNKHLSNMHSKLGVASRQELLVALMKK